MRCDLNSGRKNVFPGWLSDQSHAAVGNELSEPIALMYVHIWVQSIT